MLLRFGGCIQHLEHALCAGDGILEFRDHAGDLIERLRVLVGIRKETCKVADTHRPDPRQRTDRTECAECADGGVDQTVHETGRGVRHGCEKCCFLSGIAEFAVDLLEPCLRAILIGECLDDALIADEFFCEGTQIAAQRGLLGESIVGSRCDLCRHEQRDRCQQYDQQCDLHIDGQHENERPHDGHNACEKL